MAYEIKVFCGDDERKNIEDFTVYMAQQKNPILCGYNIKKFDNLVLQLRLMKYRMPYIGLFGKWDNIDLQEELNGYGGSGKLVDHLEYLGLETKYGGYTGADIFRLYEEDRWDEIEKYSKKDVLVEYKLYDLWNSYRKPDNKFGDVIVYDIETVPDKDKTPDEVTLFQKYKYKIEKDKRKSDATKAKDLKKFDPQEELKLWKQNAGLDKFDARIISISCCKSITKED